MSDSGKDITTAAMGLAWRMNMYTVCRLVSVSLLWGVGIAVVSISISKFVTLPVPLIFAVVSILGVSFMVGIIRGILARVSVLEAAMTADARLGLKERLSSAVELLGKEDRSGMAELQLEDAADHARSLDPKTICPRAFPVTAKLLPLAGLILILLMYAPLRYGRSIGVPAEVRRAIERTGLEIETVVKEVDKNLLSDEVAELTSEMELTGRELQDKPLTKKEALKNLSNLAREMDAMKMMGKIAEELQGKMTPEKRRVLDELLEKLADNLKDLREMGELAQKVAKALQAEPSTEALEELSAALEKMKIGPLDMKALQQMSEQVTKGKRDIGQSMARLFRAPTDAGGPDSTGQRAEEESGLMGGGAPGAKPAKDMKEAEYASRRRLPAGEGYDSEISLPVSEKGRSVPTEIQTDIERGESVVPYEEIYLEYRDVADDAISRTKIPWMYKEHVKNYFDAIKPKESQ